MSEFSQSQLDALNRMIASGVLRSEYDGQRIEYRSMAELIQARDTVKSGLGSAGSRVTHMNPAFNRGL